MNKFIKICIFIVSVLLKKDCFLHKNHLNVQMEVSFS